MKKYIIPTFAVLVLLLIGTTLTPQLWGASFSENVGQHYSQLWSSNVRTPSDVSDTIKTDRTLAQNLSDFTRDYQNLSKYSTAVLQVFGGRVSPGVNDVLVVMG